ncbi:MAG: ATP-dependent protease ATPase subunit HslU [Spirochaetaceae bacterium]|nr:ATP-dependent protease ATPase subunit HslU [Spirochaetaceae bacterium]
MTIDLDQLTPAQIVEQLDRYIVGQHRAKRSVAIALRNRMRRRKLPSELRDEVSPKNIVMIGPTGVGKTEIARRLAKLCGAPFLKVEATKYTEVGYVGRDVESMIRDLTSVAVAMVKAEEQAGVQEEAERRVEDHLLELLLPRPASGTATDDAAISEAGNSTADKLREKLRAGDLDDRPVEVTVSAQQMPNVSILSGQGVEEMDLNFSNFSNLLGGKNTKKKKASIKRARQMLLNEEIDRLVDMDRVSELAVERVQEMGIVFLDELDKIASREGRNGVDVSREGVQRDILPIVEGSKVNTRHGVVDTTHVLFIAAGAFHMSKPSDLIPELQGRFPIRVELQQLSREDFERILTQPENALIKQYTALLGTEGVELDFTPDAIVRISEVANEVNSSTENIGARRLYTILEHILEELSFHAPDAKGQKITVTAQYVDDRLSGVIEDRDLTRFIL